MMGASQQAELHISQPSHNREQDGERLNVSECEKTTTGLDCERGVNFKCDDAVQTT